MPAAIKPLKQLPIDLSGKLGLAPHFYGDDAFNTASPWMRNLAPNGTMVGGTYNPFRRNGYMSPSNVGLIPVTEDNVANFRSIRATQYDNIDLAVYLGNDTNSVWLSNNTTQFSLDHSISNCTNIQDFEIYQSNSNPVLMTLYVYSGDSSYRVARRVLSTATWTDNWIGAGGSIAGAAALGKQATKLISADNGFAYILDTNSVHKIDGTSAGGANGTFTPGVLVFPANYQVSDGVDYKGNLCFGLQNTPQSALNNTTNFIGLCGMYIWDRISTQVSQQDFVPIQGAHSISKIWVSQYDGSLRALVRMYNSTMGIAKYNGSTFTIVAQTDWDSTPNYLDSCQATASGLWWIGGNGIVYFYGSPSFEMKEGLYQIGDFSSLGLGSTNAILYYSLRADDSTVTTNNRQSPEGFYLSFGGSTGVVKKWYPHSDSPITPAPTPGIATTLPIIAGNVFTPVYNLPLYSNVEYIKILVNPIPAATYTATDTVATISVYYNQSSTAATTKIITVNDCLSGAVDIACAKAGVWAVQVQIQFNSGNLASSKDFQPYGGYIAYEPASKRR